jgi:hypothetical protein
VYADRKEFPGLFEISKSEAGNGVEVNDRRVCAAMLDSPLAE